MPLQIISPTNNTVAEVDVTPKALRTVAYDEQGNPTTDLVSQSNVLNALNGAVTLTLGGQATFCVDVESTTGTITLTFEYTVNGSTWYSLNMTPVAGGTSVTTTSANGQWVGSSTGFVSVRARVSAITASASMTVSVTASPNQSNVASLNVVASQSNPANLLAEVGGLGAAGSAVVGNPVLVGGSDGTNARTISTDSSGHQVIVGNGVAGTPAGGVVSVQGVSGGTSVPVSGTVTANQGTANTTANAWPTEITDGSHGPVAVKAASTAATATDPALVVAVSPNNSVAITAASLPLPTGAATAANQTTLGAQTTELNDGTRTATIKAASTGAATADTSLVVALSPNSPLPAGSNALGSVSVTGTSTISGTVTANQGTAASLSGAWPEKLTDGTNGPVAVKPASTAAATADPSLVVSLSPNSPLPPGTNALGSVSVTGTTAVSGTVTAAQATAANLNATVVGAGTAGTPAGGVVSIQGVSSGTSVPVSGTVTANQGTANTLANAWSGKLTDGTNGPVAVKAASTSPSSTDPSLVVALSPNAALPAFIDAAPATQSITVVDSASTSTPVSNGQVFVTGTPTAGSAASFAFSGYDDIRVQVTGTWTGTLTMEKSIDGGTTWVDGSIHVVGTSWVTNNFTANVNGVTNVSGLTNFRVRAIAAMTGTAVVRVTQTVNPNMVCVESPVRLSDGTTQSTNATIKAASTAAVSTDTSLVTSLNPNTPLPAGTNVIGALSANQSTNLAQVGGAATITGGTAGSLGVGGLGTAGTPTGGVVSVQGVSGGTSLLVSVASADSTATGSLASLNATVQITMAGYFSVGMQLAAGSLVGTIVAEASFDGGTTWNQTFFDSPTFPSVTNSFVFGSANSATAATIIGVGGAGLIRVRVSAYTSGSANVTLRASQVSDPTLLSEGATGGTAPLVASQVAGSDGTNLVPLRMKDASTQSTSADPALVVALSPASAQTRSSTSVVTGVTAQASSTTILAANSARLGAMITNNSTAILYLLYGTGTASISSGGFSVEVAISGGTHEVFAGYTGQINGIWAAANGYCNVTQLTV